MENCLATIYGKYKVSVAFQTGRVHKIPYIGIFNPRLTTSSKTGFYTVLLFDIFQKNVYISLNIGENIANKVSYENIKKYLNENINRKAFSSNDSLIALKDLSTKKNSHYSEGSINGTKIEISDLKNVNLEIDIKKIIDNYLFQTDKLIQTFLKEYENYDVIIEPSYIKNYIDFNNYQYCEAEDCNNHADYAVFLYDMYAHNNEEFLEHDYTCGYLCENHMIENENSCLGERKPRSSLSYKYSNKQGAQGYSKYLPLDLDQIFKLKIFSENSKEDYLEINKEVQVFCDLIIQEDLELPLNIGIFGDWGSGKSFFIKEISKKLNESNVDINESTPLVIEFNAWNYYDSNIIVNLVYKIFEAIQDRYNVKTKDLFENLEHYKVYADRKLSEEREEIGKRIVKLENDKEECKRNIRDEVISDIATSDHEKQLANEVISNIEHMKKYKDMTIVKEVSFMCSYIFKNISSYIYIIILILALVIGQHFLKHYGSLLYLYGGTIMAAILPLFKIFKKIESIIFKYFNKLKEQKNIEAEIISLKAELKNLEENSSEELPISYMRDFIIDKINNEDYKTNLGFIATISDDMKKLDKILKEVKMKKERESKSGIISISKIVLIIDDLDRCPEDKVVDVLQAIHLLLSTNLFIVIMAVDTKWINKCIASKYSQMLSEDNDTDKNLFAINYLEKIIHLPYWLKKMSQANSVNFIEMIGKNISQQKVELKENELNEIINDENYSGKYGSSGKIVTRYNSERHRDYINNENFHLISETDLVILNKINFLFVNTNPRKAKRFLNTILLVKNSNTYNNEKYNLILFYIASMVLKSEYTCQFYNYVINENCNNKNDFLILTQKWAEREDLLLSERKFWIDYIDHIRDLDKELFNNIIDDISEVSRFTYFHEEITCRNQSNYRYKSELGENSGVENRNDKVS